MACVVVLFVALGYWQLDRAAQKRSLADEFHRRQAAAVVRLNEVNGMADAANILPWQRVAVDGSFAKPTSILLDNQVSQSVAGYFVYTPFRLLGRDIWVLVNRGWLAVGEDRGRVPAVGVSDGALTIYGSVKAPPKTGILLAEHQYEPMGEGIYRVQTLDLAMAEEILGVRLLPYVLRMHPDSPAGFVRRWREPGYGEAKHRGYAFQWFAMAAALVVIYLVINLERVAKP